MIYARDPRGQIHSVQALDHCEWMILIKQAANIMLEHTEHQCASLLRKILYTEACAAFYSYRSVYLHLLNGMD